MTGGSRAHARVPGHVTGLFTVERGNDPKATGSRGGGLTLEAGVEVSVEPSSETTVLMGEESIDLEAAKRVLENLGESATVEVETDLPLGVGFGLSGGIALGTALAANETFDLARSTNELVTVAHVADVEAGTGLGDVVAQARGGIVLRTAAGAPGHGSLDGIPGGGRIEYLVLGELSTPDILADRPDRISRAGRRALDRLEKTPTRSTFMEASRSFTEETGLATSSIQSVLDAVEDAGGTAAMAMLGETVFGFGTVLSDAGYDPSVTRVGHTGARLRE